MYLFDIDTKDTSLSNLVQTMANLSNLPISLIGSNISSCKKNFCLINKKTASDPYTSIQKYLNDGESNSEGLAFGAFFKLYYTQVKWESDIEELKVPLHLEGMKYKYLQYELTKNISGVNKNVFQKFPTKVIQNSDYSYKIQELMYRAIDVINTNGKSKFDIKIERNVFSTKKLTLSSLVDFAVVVDSKFEDIFLYLFVFFGLFLCSIVLFFKINDERNSKMKFGLFLNGLFPSSYFISWFLSESIIIFLSVLLMVISGKYICQFAIFKTVDVFFLFLVLFLFSLSFISIWSFFSTCIKGNICSIIVSFVYLAISMVLIFLCLLDDIFFDLIFQKEVSFFTYFIPAAQYTSVIYTFDRFNQFNPNSTFGVNQFFSYFNNEESVAAFSVLSCSLFVIFQIVFLMFSTYYLDNVLYSQYKVRKSLLFCLEPFWKCCGKNKMNVDLNSIKLTNETVVPDLDKDIYSEYKKVISSIEDKSKENTLDMKIVKMSKTYTTFFKSSTKNKIALNDVTIGSKKGEVVVILGHNGAGKTTLIQCITGMISPCTGDSLIFGYPISKRMDKIKQFTGVCPQFNISFNSLTVLQHLYLFSLMKGRVPITFNWKRIFRKGFINLSKEIISLLNELELTPILNRYISYCSGGEKRRCSFAFSLLGNPKLLLLDEVSSHLDACRKKSLWNYISSIKKDKVILLTTHSMEEAEAVGDKIVFLALGRLRAIGSVDHLKRRFGFGHTLKIIFGKDHSEEKEVFVDCVEKISKKIVLLEDLEKRLTYSVPFFLSEKKKVEIFGLIESLHVQKIIKTFNLSHPTLDEIFLNVTHGRKNNCEIVNKMKEKEIRVYVEGRENEREFCRIEKRRGDTLKEARGRIMKEFLIKKSFVFLIHNYAVLKMFEKDISCAPFYSIEIRIVMEENVQEERIEIIKK